MLTSVSFLSKFCWVFSKFVLLDEDKFRVVMQFLSRTKGLSGNLVDVCCVHLVTV